MPSSTRNTKPISETLKIAREEAEAARSELRQQNEKFESARVVFMEERAQVVQKEADIHKALKQLRDERKGLQPEEESLKTWSLHQTPKETVADLQILLNRLQDERHRLKVEREQLAEVFALISRAGRTGSPRALRPLPDGSQPPSIEGLQLRMILEMGTASSAELSELLAELSALNCRLGGPGVEFLVNECRTWRLPDSSDGAARDRIAATRSRQSGNGRPFVRRNLRGPKDLWRAGQRTERRPLGPLYGEPVHGAAARCRPGKLL